MDPILDSMFACLETGDPVFLPSKMWRALNERNIRQLFDNGIENFKQTIALNYFTWVVVPHHDQFIHIVKRTKIADWPSILTGFFDYDRSPLLAERVRPQLYSLFVKMVWMYAKRNDPERLLDQLQEPELGNPFRVHSGGRIISQDLANSVLEFYAMRDGFGRGYDESVTVCELGAGYGRNAFVFLELFPHCRYIIIDIPPALYLAQHYLTRLYPGKKVFRFRPFEDSSAIRNEMNNADIVFLLPHQASSIPDKTVDLTINISSLHEMKPEQIEAYFGLFDRITRGCIYSKQWWVSRNPDDGLTIKNADYPVRPSWKEIFLRQTKLQPAFFEAMYAVGK